MTRHTQASGQPLQQAAQHPSSKVPAGAAFWDAGLTAVSSGTSVDIVIPVYNQVDYTRKCLESHRKHTPRRANVIIVDNGSTDATPGYLSMLADLKIIRNTENRGCAAAWNQGIKAATADWVAVLNNDLVLTPGWLEGLLETALECGLDIVSPALREGPLNYDLEEYAREFVKAMGGAMRPGIAHGICFLVRRRVFDKVGLFDENFRFGQFEDLDFFQRAREAGFALGATGRSFLHHFGSVTQNYVRRQLPQEAYEEQNRAYYRSKWQLTWGQRRLVRWKSKAKLAWWRAWELHQSGHSLAERWHRGQLLYE